MKARIGIFGASQCGRIFLKEIKALGLFEQVTCFFDNDPQKWDKKIEGIPILKPTTENLNSVNYCLVASIYTEEIIVDLLTKKISNIYTSVTSLKNILGIQEEHNETQNHKEKYSSFKAGRMNQPPSPNALPGKKYACTGCANNHLALAKTLAYSFLHFHPEGRFFIFLVDEKREYIQYPDTEDPRIEIIQASDLGIDHFDELSFKYDIYELCTALRPYELEFLFEKRGVDSVLMIDPDVLITAPLGPLYETLNNTSVILFPHFVFPPKNPPSLNEFNILRSGMFNCGLIGFSNSQETEIFINWWKIRLTDFCHNAQEKGLFVDQKWMDFVPCIFEQSKIVRDPSYNVAYWNLAERPLIGNHGSYSILGKPLRCFHFSSMSKHDWNNISERLYELCGIDYSLKNPVYELFCIYKELITENGFFELCDEPYSYGFFDNGIPIAPIMRKIFASSEHKSCFGNPFNTSRAHSFFEWINESAPETHSTSRLVHEIGNIETLPINNLMKTQRKSGIRALASAIAHQEILGIHDVFLPKTFDDN